MTLEEKMEVIEKLKKEYYNSDNDGLEELRNEFDKLQLSKVDFIRDEEHKHGKLFVCPDTEWEFPVVYEIAPEVMEHAQKVIYDAILEYYRESDFWDEVTDILPENLVKIYTRIHEIPIIRYFPVEDVEVLNVRKLKFEV